MITTYGVPRRGCSRPSALGIWRFVDSAYDSRERPSIADPAAAISVAVAAAAMMYFSGSEYQRGWNASATPTIGSSR